MVHFAEDWLLVGTKPGHLLLYRIKKDAGEGKAREPLGGGFPHSFRFLISLQNLPGHVN